MIATPWGLLLWWQQPEKRRELFDLHVLGLLPVVLIWFAHSYAWWKGGTGSAGLLRVFATTVPLSVLYGLHMVRMGSGSILQKRSIKFALPVLAVLAFPLGWKEARSHVPVPAAMVPEQNQVERAAHYVQQIHKPGATIAYLHPYFGVVTGLDIWDSTQAINITSLPWQLPGAGLKLNDLVVWDSHFGPNETALPLQRLSSDSSFTLLRVFEEGAGWQGTSKPFSVWVFERMRSRSNWVTDTLLQTDFGGPESWRELPQAESSPGHLTCSAWMEGYHNLHPAIPFPPDHPHVPLQELSISGEAMPGADEGNWQLTLCVNEGGKELHIHRKDMPVGSFSATFILPAEYARMEVNLRIESGEKTLGGIKGYTVVLRQFYQERLR